MDEEVSTACLDAPNDWLERVNELPDRPNSFVEERCKRFFAVDVEGRKGNDMYINILPNGVCIVGLAPSHPLIQLHRRPPADTMQPDTAQKAQPNDVQHAEPAAERQAGAETTAAGGSEPAGGTSQPLPEAQADAVPEASGGKQPLVGTKRGREGGDGQGSRGSKLTEVDSFPVAQLARVNFEIGRRSLSDVKDSGKRRSSPGMMLRPSSCLCQVESSEGQCVTISAAIHGKLLEVNGRLVTDGRLLFDRPCREGYLAILFPSPSEMKQLQEQLLPIDKYTDLRGVTFDDLR